MKMPQRDRYGTVKTRSTTAKWEFHNGPTVRENNPHVQQTTQYFGNLPNFNWAQVTDAWVAYSLAIRHASTVTPVEASFMLQSAFVFHPLPNSATSMVVAPEGRVKSSTWLRLYNPQRPWTCKKDWVYGVKAATWEIEPVVQNVALTWLVLLSQYIIMLIRLHNLPVSYRIYISYFFASLQTFL